MSSREDVKAMEYEGKGGGGLDGCLGYKHWNITKNRIEKHELSWKNKGRSEVQRHPEQDRVKRG
jgi:hypothetical protein